MRSTEELIRAFVKTDPAPKEFSVGSKEDGDLPEKVRSYQRDRLVLEVLLDIRDSVSKK